MMTPIAVRAIANVLRGEGFASALRRARERVDEALHGAFVNDAEAPIVNVSATRVVPRLGGVPIQLLNRLREERKLRSVVLLEAGAATFEQRVRASGARAIHIEGTYDVPPRAVLRLMDDGVRVVVSVHDFSLMEDRDGARALLPRAEAVIFPSRFLADEYRQLSSFQPHVIEPGVPPAQPAPPADRHAIAYAGAVKPHKGARLLGEIARDVPCHVFGGGDADLLRDLRRRGNFVVHGYYRAGELPSLLARHGVGLVVLPSIVAESYSLTLSEVWQAGAIVAAFDHGAIAQRIREHGGGVLAPLASGAAGLRAVVEQWMRGEVDVEVPRALASSADAARDHVALYESLGLNPAAR